MAVKTTSAARARCKAEGLQEQMTEQRPLLTPANDTAPAEWLVAAITEFATTVTPSLVPPAFESVVRVFHHAYRDVASMTVAEGPGQREWDPVTWGEIAAATGKQVHSAMQLASITGIDPRGSHDLPGVYDDGPQVGTLPSDVARELVDVLARHTATPDDCWFGVWAGWGLLREDVERAPIFKLPGREYNLMRGPIAAATENVESRHFLNLNWRPVDGTVVTADQPPVVRREPNNEWPQLPNIWWPDDHAWCL